MSVRQPLNLSCKCRGCALAFSIPELDSFIIDSENDGFSVSDLVCPRCRQRKIDVKINIAQKQQAAKYEITDAIEDRLKDAVEEYRTADDKSEALEKFGASLVSILFDMTKAVKKNRSSSPTI